MGVSNPTGVGGRADLGAPPSAAYRRYVLGLLVLVYICNFVDRSILGILAEPIRQEMGVSDTALGFLGGFAFAMIYSTAGIPVARWADVGSRRGIIALGLAFWSAMTMLCGFATSFPQLVLARIGVGLGESACSPPAHALISDYFPPERRATALAIYATGIPLGTGIGTMVGGWVSEVFDWRTAFLVVGLPGIALAIIVQQTLREPPRGRFDSGEPAAAALTRESMREVFSFLWQLRSFRHLSLAAALHSLYAYAASVGAFGALFFERIHGLSRSEIGLYLGGIAIVFGTLSAFLGGRVGDWLGRSDARWYFWVPALSTALGIPLAACQYLAPQAQVAIAFAVPNAILGGMFIGPTFGVTQALVPPRMRATAAAVVLLIINLIGLGLGPLLTGILSDALGAAGVEGSIRYALLIVVCLGAAWSSLHYVLGAGSLRGDLKARESLAASAA